MTEARSQTSSAATLSEQQQAFCTHYAAYGNGAAAARAAYPKTAKLSRDRQSELGRRLLRKSKIMARIAGHSDSEPAPARSRKGPVSAKRTVPERGAREADVDARLARAGIQRRGLRLEEAAAYAGLSPRAFLDEVGAGNMPRPLRLKLRRRVWDRLALDRAIEIAQGNSGGAYDPIMAAIVSGGRREEKDD